MRIFCKYLWSESVYEWSDDRYKMPSVHLKTSPTQPRALLDLPLSLPHFFKHLLTWGLLIEIGSPLGISINNQVCFLVHLWGSFHWFWGFHSIYGLPHQAISIKNYKYTKISYKPLMRLVILLKFGGCGTRQHHSLGDKQLFNKQYAFLFLRCPLAVPPLENFQTLVLLHHSLASQNHILYLFPLGSTIKKKCILFSPVEKFTLPFFCPGAIW